jgi:hypothetical protein
MFGAWALDTSQRDSLKGSVHESDALRSLHAWRCEHADNTLLAYDQDDPKDAEKKLEDTRNRLGVVFDAAQDSFNKESNPAGKGVMPNPQFMCVFLNWGDTLSPFWPYDQWPSTANYQDDEPVNTDYPIFHDFSTPLFGQLSPDPVWSNERSKAEISGPTDNIGKFVTTVYETPLAGAYMTDFYKGIHTSDANVLNSSKGKAKKVGDVIDDVMLDLLGAEKNELQEALNLSDTTRSPIVLATGSVFAEIRKASKTDQFPPKYVIRWPHHSGSGARYFKIPSLAYAYGRVDRALTEQHIEHHWPFVSPRVSPSDDSLRQWFADGFDGRTPGVMCWAPAKDHREVSFAQVNAAFLLGWYDEEFIITRERLGNVPQSVTDEREQWGMDARPKMDGEYLGTLLPEEKVLDEIVKHMGNRC